MIVIEYDLYTARIGKLNVKFIRIQNENLELIKTLISHHTTNYKHVVQCSVIM